MQPSEATIDYSAVEQALAHNEAPARMRIMAGQGLRALAVLIGLSTLALAAGYAWHLAKEPKVETVEKIVEVPVPGPNLPQPPKQEDSTKIVRNYVIFQHVAADMVQNGLSVNAGHNYENSKQATYSDAFCYVAKGQNGSLIRVELSEKEPNKKPVIVPGDNKALNLATSDMAELRALCPYL